MSIHESLNEEQEVVVIRFESMGADNGTLTAGAPADARREMKGRLWKFSGSRSSLEV